MHRKAGGGHRSLDRPAFLLLLLTPAFARHALDPTLPLLALEKLQLNGPPKLRNPLQTVTAVVDQVPVHGEHTGAEGLAYNFVLSGHRGVLDERKALPASAQKPASLNFEIAPYPPQRPQRYGFQLPLAQTIFSTGHVSTLIHRCYTPNPDNGLLELSGPECNLESMNLGIPTGERKVRVKTQFPLVPLTPFRRITHSMGNIVRTLTANTAYNDPESDNTPDAGDQSTTTTSALPEESQPASQELEAAISAYFDAQDMHPEPVAVWALVVPSEAYVRSCQKDVNRKSKRVLSKLAEDSIRQTWTSHRGTHVEEMGTQKRQQDGHEHDGSTTMKGVRSMAKHINIGIRELLVKDGARLCKVLSGGGGWGKKAGLLSLDPDSSYSTRELRGEEGWEVDFDGKETADGEEGASEEAKVEKQKKAALGEIVMEGEVVMFFLAPKNVNSTALDGKKEEVEGGNEEEPVCFSDSEPTREAIFGTLPSSIDTAVPANAPSTADLEPSSQPPVTIQHYPDKYGMLSEGGMALTVSGPGSGVRTSTSTSTNANGEDRLTQTQTKIDVPYSQVSITQLGLEENVEKKKRKGVGRDASRAGKKGGIDEAETHAEAKRMTQVPLRRKGRSLKAKSTLESGRVPTQRSKASKPAEKERYIVELANDGSVVSSTVRKASKLRMRTKKRMLEVKEGTPLRKFWVRDSGSEANFQGPEREGRMEEYFQSAEDLPESGSEPSGYGPGSSSGRGGA